MLADELDYVICVDTHRDEHVLAVVTAPAGAVVARRAIGADGRGYREALRFAEQVAAGRRAWAVEGTGSYGAGLARSLSMQAKPCSRSTARHAASGAGRQRRLARRVRTLDALASETLALPRSGERREALRVLLSRAAAPSTSVAMHSTQLRAVIVTRRSGSARSCGATRGKLLARCSRLRRAVQPTSSRPARAAQPRPPHPSRNTRSRRTRAEILARVRALTPALLENRESADRRRPTDRLLSHRGRCALKPASPASPARPSPRLKRPNDPIPPQPRGDRQLNRALHTIVLHRRHHDPTTRDYIAKHRRSKSRRDATRY